MSNICVIPDCHSTPGDPGHRFTWLGKFIVDERPDTIVVLGDFADMASLSSYDKGKGSAEGRRVKADLEWAQTHQQMVWDPLIALREGQRANRKKQYSPDVRWLEGNHEYRIRRFENDNPALIGSLPTELITYDEHSTIFYPFLEFCYVDGIVFSHYFPSRMGRALGGAYPGRTILQHNKMSCVSGHAHIWDLDVKTRADGRKMFGLCAGWYGNMDHAEEFSKGSDHTWWNGITMLYGVEDGSFRELRAISQERLKEKYG